MVFQLAVKNELGVGRIDNKLIRICPWRCGEVEEESASAYMYSNLYVW